jgi:hypothetical protein
MDYRFEKKQFTLAFGAYPTVTLADARSKRDGVKVLLAKGLDPRTSKAEPEIDTTGRSLREVGEAWFAAQLPQWKPSYSERIKTRLERDLFDELGDMPLSAITKPILLKALRKVEDRGATHIAKRLKNHVCQIASKRDPLFASKNDPLGVQECHVSTGFGSAMGIGLLERLERREGIARPEFQPLQQQILLSAGRRVSCGF